MLPPDQMQEIHRIQLKAYEQAYGLRGLEGRLLRGIDPAGMLAINETAKIVKNRLAEFPNSSYENLIVITNRLHIGGLWRYADRLELAVEPEVRMWLLMAYACIESGKDLSPEEYLRDFERVKTTLEITDITEAVGKMHHDSRNAFWLDDYKGAEIPFSKRDAFLSMAIAGYAFGVVYNQNEDLYYVGSDKLDYDSFAKEQGLVAIEKEDRGRVSTFYQKDGKDLVKRLYDGLAIVYGNKELAFELALKHI